MTATLSAAEVLRRNHVTSFGRGTRPMLFAHGFGCDQTLWRLVAPAFADTHRVVLFDYVGGGRSDRERRSRRPPSPSGGG